MQDSEQLEDIPHLFGRRNQNDAPFVLLRRSQGSDENAGARARDVLQLVDVDNELIDAPLEVLFKGFFHALEIAGIEIAVHFEIGQVLAD